MKPWNHWYQETYETIDTTTPMKPRNLWNHKTIDTTNPMKPRNLWNQLHHKTLIRAP